MDTRHKIGGNKADSRRTHVKNRGGFMLFFPGVVQKGFLLPGGAKFSEKYTSLGIEKVMQISISVFKILSLEFVQCVV